MNIGSRGTVQPLYTIGFGNNLFQYCCARLLAEKNEFVFFHNPSLLEQEGLFKIGLEETEQSVDHSSRELDTFYITDSNYKEALESDSLPDANYVVSGYFEDYTVYRPYLKEIRSWFPRQEKTNYDDLILHFRLQNRLIQETHCRNHVSFDVFERGIDKFEFGKLHIVTDAKKWDFYSKQDIEEIQEEIRLGPNPPSNSPWVDTEYSINYVNRLIEGFSKYDLVVHCNDAGTIPGSGGLRGDFIDDFNLLRKFDKIMFKDSTFSWWAALLSDAAHVSAYGPWKPNKGAGNKNLGLADFPGWFSWGT